MFFFSNTQKQKERAQWLADLRPVVLMGRGHSGTRVLSRVCTALGLNLGASDTLATGDADDQIFTQQIKKVATNNVATTAPQALQERDLVEFQQAVAGYYERLGRPDQQWGWKFPETYLIAPYIAKTFPQARYIHLVRDGRDIAFKRHLTDDPQRTLGWKLLSYCGALHLPHYLQAGISWAFQVDNFDRFRSTVPTGQILDVTFEDLCLHSQQVAHHIGDFFDLPFTQACEQYIAEKINTKKVAQYQENDPEQVRQVEARIASTLKRYAYLGS